MRWSLTALCVIALSATGTKDAAAQVIRPPTLDSLRVLALDSVSGVATAYFRADHRTRALALQSLLEDFLAFYRQHASVDARMRVAVVDSADWLRLTNTPYGLPTNSGLSADNLLLAAATPRERVGVRTMPVGEVGDFLIIGHEGGHLLTWELLPPEMRSAVTGSSPPSPQVVDRFRALGRTPAWYWELVANYFTTAFLDRRDPDAAAAWLEHLREISTVDRPRFTHLDHWFGRVMEATTPDSTPYRFSTEGALNQGWYQGVVGQVAAHIYQHAGLSFIDHVRSALRNVTPPRTQQLVEQLETIAPGVTRLLTQLGAQWDDPS